MSSLRNLLKDKVMPLLPFYKKAHKKIALLQAKAEFLNKEHQEIANKLDSIDTSYLKEIDKRHLMHLIRHRLGYEPDLDNPKTFNEKLQWLKINLRRPEMITMSDKYRVREYLKENGFGKYLNRLHGVYKNTKELKADWARLPSRFVIKTNNDSGSIMLVNNKDSFNHSSLDKLKSRLQRNYYYHLEHYNDGRQEIYYRKCEWPYKDIEPFILAEEYLEDQPGSLRDYKVFCFNGKAIYIQVDIDRFTNHTKCFFDTDWNKVNIRKNTYEGQVEKPLVLEEILQQSEKLANGYPFIRVDWYILESDRLVLGELTFYPASGARAFDLPEWDRKLGALIDLSEVDLE